MHCEHSKMHEQPKEGPISTTVLGVTSENLQSVRVAWPSSYVAVEICSRRLLSPSWPFGPLHKKTILFFFFFSSVLQTTTDTLYACKENSIETTNKRSPPSIINNWSSHVVEFCGHQLLGERATATGQEEMEMEQKGKGKRSPTLFIGNFLGLVFCVWVCVREYSCLLRYRLLPS